MSEYTILSVGGSIVIPTSGFDIKFLKKFRAIILSRVKKGDKFILIIGGGGTCRKYQEAAKKIANLNNNELDWLGIHTTWYNAEFVRLMFGKMAYGEVIKNPTKKINTKKPIIVAGGWKPGCSTDYDAVLLAKAYKVKKLINMSNIDYVYTADPKKVKSATPIKELNWSEMKKIIGRKWIPGANLPLDPKATNQAGKLGLKVMFINGNSLKQLQLALDGGKIRGTVVQ